MKFNSLKGGREVHCLEKSVAGYSATVQYELPQHYFPSFKFSNYFQFLKYIQVDAFLFLNIVRHCGGLKQVNCIARSGDKTVYHLW